MMRPYFAGIIACFATARAILNVPNRSMLSSFMNWSSVMSSAGATAPVPALLMRMSIRPNLSMTVFTAFSTISVSVMSHLTARVSTPYSLARSAATSSMRFCRRATATMLHPWRARAFAICTPSPVEQPVTMATLPFRSKRSLMGITSLFSEK